MSTLPGKVIRQRYFGVICGSFLRNIGFNLQKYITYYSLHNDIY